MRDNDGNLWPRLETSYDCICFSEAEFQKRIFAVNFSKTKNKAARVIRLKYARCAVSFGLKVKLKSPLFEGISYMGQSVRKCEVTLYWGALGGGNNSFSIITAFLKEFWKKGGTLKSWY